MIDPARLRETLTNARNVLLAERDAEGHWTGELSMLISRGKSLDDASGERAAYEKVTAADVKAVFNKYYGTGTTLRVVLKPKAAEPIVPPLPGGGK